ncbi:MAG TPA: acetate--CoA ligase [Candidatus Marinimicrobia bacterium]|nr:acetate--CoA ligase [Candidatus Neomarinimicrobiota bacterium]
MVNTFSPTQNASKNAHIPSFDRYDEIYKRSIDDPENFWAETAQRIHWIKPWDTVRNFDFVQGRIEWFSGGKLNACYNCIDRHIENGHGDETAIIWEGNDPNQSRKFSYNELLKDVSQFANALKSMGVEKGDRVCLYMQMIPELAVAVLACARIGAVHSVVFGAFSSDSLRDRINDSECKILVTQDTGVRGTKQTIPMKVNADNAVAATPSIDHVVVVRRTGEPIEMDANRDTWWHEAVSGVEANCEPEVMDSEDPLFILYTSGSTGKPKGVLHTTGGYLTYASFTHEMVFDYKPGDIYWCTADLGWITGHSYIVYGPLANRATTVMFEGVPNYPDFGRFWDVVDKHRVNQFYTAPTALRALMKEGNDWVTSRDLSSLRLLGTVGEPIKEPEWTWYHEIVGKGKCPIVDTWWQTETGGILITPLPGATPTKPGSATFPFFGVEPVLMTEDGQEIEGNDVSGLLVIKSSWPGQMRTIYGDHDRFLDVYFSQFPGYYFTGDGAKRDKDGYYWITGRVDDVLNVSGHRIGTAEVEGAIGKAKGVAEAAVVGFSHDIKGQGIYAFVTLMTGIEPSDKIHADVLASVTKEIGPHAKPDEIQFTPALPKTRSGKIMRRILRNIAEEDLDNMGDISTLADPTVVESLTSGRR